MPDAHQYCTFFVDGHYFGLDVLKVQEIIRYQEMTARAAGPARRARADQPARPDRDGHRPPPPPGAAATGPPTSSR